MFKKAYLPPKRILISGAGIAGLALARQCKTLNIPFMLIEKKAEWLADGAGIALPANAVKALRYMNLGDDIDEASHQVNAIIYTDASGEVLSEASLLQTPLNVDKFVALSRQQLHRILLKDLEASIHFDTTIKQTSETKDGLLVTFNHDSLKPEEFSAIIGADGIHSEVRQHHFAETPLVDLGVNIWRWICDYPTQELQPTYMLDKQQVFMAYPIANNKVYCYAHVFDANSEPQAETDHKADVLRQFSHFGGIAKTMLEILPDQQKIIPGRLLSVSKPLFASKKVALIGDASHACSPMLQQGAAAALEDVIVLSELLKHFPVQEALSHYEKCRSERVNWITAASDGPIKMLTNIDAGIFSAIQQKIKENGPFNVQGWKQLLAVDPLQDIQRYIENNRMVTELRFHCH